MTKIPEKSFILQTVDVNRSFGMVTAADNLNIEVNPGEMVGIVGANEPFANFERALLVIDTTNRIHFNYNSTWLPSVRGHATFADALSDLQRLPIPAWRRPVAMKAAANTTKLVLATGIASIYARDAMAARAANREESSGTGTSFSGRVSR